MVHRCHRSPTVALAAVCLLAGACIAEIHDPEFEEADTRLYAGGDTLTSQEFSSSSWSSPWQIDSASQASWTSSGYRGGGLRVRIAAHGHYGNSMSLRLANHGGERDDLYFRYYLKFGDNWRPEVSGKLPGVADLNGSYRCRGGKPPTSTTPCWSARMMFKPASGGTNIGFYTYHYDQKGTYGDGDLFSAQGYTPLARGRWYCVEGYVKMNDPGQANGVLKGWINGKPALERGDFRFRNNNNLHVERLWHNIYYGGKPTAPADMDVYVDSVVLSKSRIGCNSKRNDPMWEPGAEDEYFKDVPPDSFGAPAINALLRAGITNGCRKGDNPMFCPRAYSNRAEVGAFLSRSLELPRASADYFDDDDGHWSEGSNNKLYEAGITRGCGNRRFCPNRLTTRAEMATFLVRAFDLPATDVDYFTDDDGSVHEQNINALFESGITRGCGEDAFCPDRNLTRAEMAIFVHRARKL